MTEHQETTLRNTVRKTFEDDMQARDILHNFLFAHKWTDQIERLVKWARDGGAALNWDEVRRVVLSESRKLSIAERPLRDAMVRAMLAEIKAERDAESESEVQS